MWSSSSLFGSENKLHKYRSRITEVRLCTLSVSACPSCASAAPKYLTHSVVAAGAQHPQVCDCPRAAQKTGTAASFCGRAVRFASTACTRVTGPLRRRRHSPGRVMSSSCWQSTRCAERARRVRSARLRTLVLLFLCKRYFQFFAHCISLLCWLLASSNALEWIPGAHPFKVTYARTNLTLPCHVCTATGARPPRKRSSSICAR